MQLYTIGHSNKPLQNLLAMLQAHGIDLLCDVRRYPRSRRHPQFNSETLRLALAGEGIDYRHVESLGGRRDPADGSVNTALREPAFRGYADHMASAEFQEAIDALIEAAAARRTVIMCAEADPEHCHRSLIADALLVRGIEVVHISPTGARQPKLSPLARVENARVTYPALF